MPNAEGTAGAPSPAAASRAPASAAAGPRLVRLAAATAGAVGATVLVGWATGLTRLTTVGADISMKPNTAVCFVLLGAALWRRASRREVDPLSFALGTAASAVGGLTLLEHLAGVDLGIDQLLFHEPPGMPGTAAPARMGPPASLSFLLLGTALAWMNVRHAGARSAVQAMALATALVALLPLVGYAYGTRELYGVARFTAIALPTAVLLELLAVTVLAAAPGPGLGSVVRRAGGATRFARRTLLYTTAVPLAAGWLIAQGLRRGMYDGTFAVSSLVLVLILSVTLLTWRDVVHVARLERRRETAEAARRASEEQARTRAAELEAVLAAVPAAVFITHDRDSRRIEGNRVAQALLGVAPGANLSMSAPSPEVGAGQRFAERGVEVPAHELPVQVAAARGIEIRDRELELVRGDGTVRHLLGNASPLLDAQGRSRGAVGAFVDITARVEAEQELRDADRRKDAFLAVLSHELRNPLAPIRNSLFLLGRPGVSAEQASRSIAVIERQVGQLTRLVEDLLDLSRISRGRVELQRARVDLVELARRTLEDYRGAAAAAGLTLADELPDAPLWVDGDATRLAQVIGNLLANAVKFTPPGGRVHVGAAREGDRTAVLRVRDTGAGIDAGMRARLFQPFAQADATLDRSRGGLGLGLALVKGFVELHGGAVEARSDGLGAGAELVVRLPLEGAPPPAGAAAPVAPAAPLRILVIEDNRDAAQSLRDVLEVSGHDVRVAHDADEGLAAARRSRSDVVICDIGLPGRSGYEVAHALRADPSTRHVALIAVTGYATPDDRRRATEAGFDRHFGKPVDPGRLTDVLREVSQALPSSGA